MVSLTVASGICSVEELLDLLSVLDAHLENEPAPVDGHNPANDVHRGEHLNDPDSELCLAPLFRVTHATTDHSARARQDNVQDEADVGPDAAQSGQITDEVPQISILLTVHRDRFLGVLKTLFGCISRCSLVVLALRVLLWLVKASCIEGSLPTNVLVLSHFVSRLFILIIKIQIIINKVFKTIFLKIKDSTLVQKF